MYAVRSLERVVRKEPLDRIIEIRRQFHDQERPPVAPEFRERRLNDRMGFGSLALLASGRRKGLGEGEPRYGPRLPCPHATLPSVERYDSSADYLAALASRGALPPGFGVATAATALANHGWSEAGTGALRYQRDCRSG